MAGGVAKASAKAISEVANNIRSLSDDETIDEVLKALRRAEPLPKEDAIPQYRGALHEVDPSFVSSYTGREATFASSNSEFAINWALRDRLEEPAYFHKFEDLTEDEVFDPTRSEAGAILKWSNRHIEDPEKQRSLNELIVDVRDRGLWNKVEGGMYEGFFDNLPDNFKAVRIRGEDDNYVYLGRQIPKSDKIETITLPTRKHYIGTLGELNHFLADYSDLYTAKDGLRNMARREFADLQKAWDKEKQVLVNNAPRGYTGIVDILFARIADELSQPTPMLNYHSANVYGTTDTATKEHIKLILSSVDDKEEAKDLLKAMIIGPKLRVDTPRAKKDLAITGKIFKQLRDTPDSGFNMLKFIKDNNLYSVVLPALGIGSALQDEDETDSALQELKQ